MFIPGYSCEIQVLTVFQDIEDSSDERDYIQSVQLKSGPYFNMSNLFTKIYNILYYTTNLYLQ